MAYLRQLSIPRQLTRVSPVIAFDTCLYKDAPDLNVFTLNKRSVMLIHANLGPNKPTVPMAFVAVGGAFIFIQSSASWLTACI